MSYKMTYTVSSGTLNSTIPYHTSDSVCACEGYPSTKPWLAVYANWGEERCHGRSVRGVCVFGVGDLPLLLSRRELFANKLYEDQQPVTLDCLEAWIRHKEVCPPNDDLDYYRQLPFVLTY